jgi:hypothetical protein
MFFSMSYTIIYKKNLKEKDWKITWKIEVWPSNVCDFSGKRHRERVDYSWLSGIIELLKNQTDQTLDCKRQIWVSFSWRKYNIQKALYRLTTV